ncbi:MAG: antibiotic biosynthesis monooxygenase [Lentisphaeria bacterium]|nr:antibiotic biosynthesis monooxygenase [Lentisphaeria bacterium]
MVHVVARMELNENCFDKMMDILRDLVPVVRAEDGCIMYNPSMDVDGNKTFLTIVESWESEAHLKAHLASPHMADYRVAVADLRKSSDVKVMTPVL